MDSECMTSDKTNMVQLSLCKNCNSDRRYKMTVPAVCRVMYE